MSMTDPVADMLTRIRNGYRAKHSKIDVPASNMKVAVARILQTEGFILDTDVIEDSRQNVLRVFLKYDDQERPAVAGLKRISKPGLRKYTDARDIPRVLGGLGVAIISTPKGILTDRQARRERVGGEIICYVW